MPGADTPRTLLVLRHALDAFASRADDLPDLDALRAILGALDPTFSDELATPVAWNEGTGLPDPAWLDRLGRARDLLAVEAEDTTPADVVIAAVGAVAARARLQRRTVARFLQRAPVFPAAAEVRRWRDGVAWVWDAVLADGRWGRIVVPGREVRRPLPVWLTMPFEDLEAEVAYEPVRRAIVGPAVRDDAGRTLGLCATVEASGEPPWRRVAVDRMAAEDLDVPGFGVIPVAVPSPD